MNVLVYTGPEVLQSSFNSTLSSLRSILVPNYSVQSISLQALNNQPWTISCALLVVPQCQSSIPSSAAKSVQNYVRDGGAFLSIGNGARFALNTKRPAYGLEGSETTLHFYDNVSNGYVYLNSLGSGTDTALRSADIKTKNGEIVKALLSVNKSSLEGFEEAINFSILARYVEHGSEGSIAGIASDFGRGKIAIWAPDLGLPTKELPGLMNEGIEPGEKPRIKLFSNTLSQLGIQLPPSEDPATSKPLPQFLVSTPTKSRIVTRITESLATPPSTMKENIFKDSNDTFHFHLYTNIMEVLRTAREESDPLTWQPKHIIICPEGQLPDRKLTPLFDINSFFEYLASARSKEQCSDVPSTWGFGEALFYGEAVTSTQTMLDKNPQFVSLLPTPILSIASRQLSGRGRGSNIWLSPLGCLQFSLLLRVSLSSFPASKLVFIQYLFALAVVEACREDTVLGGKGEQVRLKWPNDIYALVGPEEKKKIGGILVNTSFSGGQVDVVIGCGLNVLNEPPITSLSQLLPAEERQRLSMERATAAIMSKFEVMWDTFLRERGSFDSFMDLYLQRWLHSDQLVTITTTTPPTAVRIIGLTPDFGLLRTMPERTGWSSTSEQGFIDLQPDGNSFDLMNGLIKSKS